MTDDARIVDNSAEQRIELTVDGHLAFADYELDGQRIVFTHTEVPEELQGQGIGSTLVRGALDLARERELEVIPSCPFVANYVREHPAYLDLVSEQTRQRMQLN